MSNVDWLLHMGKFLLVANAIGDVHQKRQHKGPTNLIKSSVVVRGDRDSKVD